ncbi:gnu [Drosophila busckii]|uniref:Gnu n=1 Tax=Drosophila busckii TaxID=30019 RepID=A0A0M4EKL3_DROBS|nr:uncharacterized protein LOC108599344 [Drosophila busckii]ALC43810.1 gnu [Drosophila busckii]
MDKYNRAWRDPKSPLTPITPLSTQVFSFEKMASPHTPAEEPRKNTFKGLKPSRFKYSSEFMRKRCVFSPNAQSTVCGSSPLVFPPKSTRSIKKENSSASTANLSTTRPQVHKFKRSSPVEQPSLCPRVRSLLDRTGNGHLTELFTRQEIDIDVLIQMTLEELEKLGVRGAKELKLAIDVIKLAKRFF